MGLTINSEATHEADCPAWLMESAPSTETVFNGRACLYFGGTSYFGLHADPGLMAEGIRAWQELGHGTATSRSGMGTTPLYLQVEQAAAEFFNSDSAAYLPSGYLSNLAGLKALHEAGEFDVIFIDEHSHFSAFDAARATGAPTHSFAHMTPSDLEAKLKTHLQSRQTPLVLGDGLFPTLGQIPPVPEIVEVLKPYRGLLWLDEAHSMGILGPNGRGVYEHFGLIGDCLLSGGTLAKAFGGFGGVIPGSAGLIQKVMGGQVMAGASAVPPPLAAATLAGIKRVAANPQWRERLWANGRLLKKGIRSLGFDVEDSDVPIAAFKFGNLESMKKVHCDLLGRGIAIQHSHYAGVGVDGVLRAVVFSTHTPAQIQRLLDELGQLV
jgi:7-keto-8-aminopelargonate synthetase-like enzyme